MAKILLINSERASRQILEHAFMLYEHEVITTQHGDEGVTLAVTESPDVIVMDMDAMGLNGWQVIKVLKESSTTWSIPVIAMADPTITGQMLLQTGFDTYERKPVSARHILQKIDGLVDNAMTVQGLPKPMSSLSPAVGRPTQASGDDAHGDQSSRTTVVYVDDNLADSQAMAEIVKGAGYRYVNISDPLQILPQLIEHGPQLIFLELALPVANGYELCAQIRRLSAFKKTPIIFVTNNDRIADRVRAKLVGASDFLSKPIRVKSVLKVLIKYLSSRSKV
ncbi:MAG: response regulator [Cyanobacteria bacterium P01_B01_bin.77]